MKMQINKILKHMVILLIQQPKATRTTTTVHPDLTTTEKTVSERDKIQLRNYIHRVLSNWKKEHQNDKIVTIADLMHDELAREEPS